MNTMARRAAGVHMTTLPFKLHYSSRPNSAGERFSFKCQNG